MDLLCYLSFYPVTQAGGAEPVPLTIGRWKKFSILNCQLLRPNGGGVKRSTERSVKKSRLSEPKASFPRF